MRLDDYLDTDLLKEMIDKKYVDVSTDTKAHLMLFNYSPSCQFERVWNDVTMKCRGLIVDMIDHQIVARPYIKFFNYEELDPTSVPTCSFTISEKIDGSLGILYWVGDDARITTKGSFTSFQALHATEILNTKYANVLSSLDKGKTYLFEIVFPKDRHCIQYPGVDDIILTGVIDINTGEEEDPEDYCNIFNVAKKYDCDDWVNIRKIVDPDSKTKEGYVVKFNDAENTRIKLKYEEYWKLHYLKASISGKKIFKLVKDGDYDSLNMLKSLVDEENEIMIDTMANSYSEQFEKVLTTAIDEFKNVDVVSYVGDDGSVKLDISTVNQCKSSTYPHLMFMLVKGQDITKSCWDIVAKHMKFDIDSMDKIFDNIYENNN